VPSSFFGKTGGLEQDDFGLSHAKIMNVTGSKSLERDAGEPNPSLSAARLQAARSG
jgi:hypothetical protein